MVLSLWKARDQAHGQQRCVSKPCKLLTINGADVQTLPKPSFEAMMQCRPVTLAFQALQFVEASDALSQRCRSAVENLRAPPSLSETFGFINAILGEHQLALAHAELRPAEEVARVKTQALTSPSSPETPVTPAVVKREKKTARHASLQSLPKSTQILQRSLNEARTVAARRG